MIHRWGESLSRYSYLDRQYEALVKLHCEHDDSSFGISLLTEPTFR